MLGNNNKPFRPLLAATIESNADLEQLTYPLIGSPKVDGIRCICHPVMGPITRSSKPIRNDNIRGVLSYPLCAGLDGEIVSGSITAPDVFNKTTTAVMTQHGVYSFTYWVFDTMAMPDYPYVFRLDNVDARMSEIREPLNELVKALPWKYVERPEDILEAEIEWLSQGFEGVMLRRADGRYKQGRSTLKEQILMKLKRFKDAEAIIVGFEELERNTNPQTRSLQGLAERSDHKAGKVAAETLGALLVRDCTTDRVFSVGSGFDESQRAEIWSNRQSYNGKRITYKFQEVGVKEKPRFPIFKGLRED